MAINSPVNKNKFVTSSTASRAKALTDWSAESRSRSSVDGNFAGYNANTVQRVTDFIAQNGKSNPPFKYHNFTRADLLTKSKDPNITRGYIRRSDTSDDIGGASLNFMFNPEQIVRDYVSYLDQAALDPFNTLYQSGNLVNPPSFVNFSFSLLFDRQDDMALNPKDNRGCLVDYQYFDLVVRNVPPSVNGTPDVPDNGVMMVNPKDITVVFSGDLTVQGRPTNARVTFLKFDHRMVPMRMQVDLTMIITYFGPLRSAFGLDTFQAIKKYDALVPYADTVGAIYSAEDVNAAIQAYNASIPLTNVSSGTTGSAATQVYGAAGVASVPNDSLRLQALRIATDLVAGHPPYVWGASGPSSYDCSGLVYAAYHKLGAAKLLAGHENGRTSTSEIASYQKSHNWNTMPIVVNGGTYSTAVKTAMQNSVQKGDIVLKNNGSEGHIMFFDDWVDSKKERAWVVEAASTAKGCGRFQITLKYLCSFNWVLRPTLAGSQSIAGGVK